jgi:hypothetical protein
MQVKNQNKFQLLKDTLSTFAIFNLCQGDSGWSILTKMI